MGMLNLGWRKLEIEKTQKRKETKKMKEKKMKMMRLILAVIAAIGVNAAYGANSKEDENLSANIERFNKGICLSVKTNCEEAATDNCKVVTNASVEGKVCEFKLAISSETEDINIEAIKGENSGSGMYQEFWNFEYKLINFPPMLSNLIFEGEQLTDIG